MALKSDFDTLLVRVHEQLESNDFRQRATDYDRRPLIRMANALGGPRMKLVHWRRQWVLNKHGFLPEIFFWIDFSCIDQNDTSVAVPLLPIWVACCERFLRIDTDDYDSRAWCRVEPLLAYMFSFADHHLSIDLSYNCKWPDTGTETRLPILNPTDAETTLPEDQRLIAPLTNLAMASEPAIAGHMAVQFGATSVKCFKL